MKTGIAVDYEKMFREPGGALAYPFFTPGSKQYNDVLWDWDAWTANVALRQILADAADADARKKARDYERGCILNFTSTCCAGFIPISVGREKQAWPEDLRHVNMHKPCLAQHAAFLVKEDGGDAEWLREAFYPIQQFLNFYRNHHRHERTGLYYWQDDHCIGVDNDPCTFGRPPRSSGSIYLNTMMYRELLGAAYLAEQLNLGEIAVQYNREAEALKTVIQTHCWDERDGFFYSVDLHVGRQELKNLWGSNWGMHCGYPCDWPCLIQRIGVWSGFMALWSGVATPEQAARIATEHYWNEKTFHSPWGVRTLSKMERMYNVKAMGNPSSWLGPIWGISNYMTWRGFVRYGIEDAANDLADNTIRLFGRDMERFGALHEYYLPENGEPVLNRGFQNWNYLVLNMIAWKEGRAWISEF